MSFEDFKRHFGLVSPIDTPEKLQICKTRYKAHLRMLEGEDYFEPYEIPSTQEITAKYKRKLWQLLGENSLTANQIHILVQPSFEPEYAFLLTPSDDHVRLDYTVLHENSWYPFQQYNEVVVAKTSSTLLLDEKRGTKFLELLRDQHQRAKKTPLAGIILDGTLFFISILVNGRSKTVFKHSPDSNSMAGTTTEIILALKELIHSQGPDTINEFDKRINQLESRIAGQTKDLPTHVLFCCNPLEPKKPDPDFEAEFTAAQANGFTTFLIDFDKLVEQDDAVTTIKHLTPALKEMPVLYRGWMLRPSLYQKLFDALLTKNYRLINSPESYKTCHHLPESLPYIAYETPQTVFEKWNDASSMDRLLEKTTVFGSKPVIIKDYVKSEKHHWRTACFIENASDTEAFRQTVSNFLALRGDQLNEGIVVREFVELHELTTHSKSGMPLKEEYRLFFVYGKLLGVFDYWEEGSYNTGRPDVEDFELLARQIPSQFFSMDIARCKSGEFILVELGDGQVSGLPDSLDPMHFYAALKTI